MDKFHYLKVTHATLEQALLKLGFKVSLHETHRLYENEEHGTLLMLPPNIPMEQQVRPAHLSSVRHAVVAFKVADEAMLTKLLTEPGLAASPDVNGEGHTAHRGHSAKPRIPTPAIPVEAG